MMGRRPGLNRPPGIKDDEKVRNAALSVGIGVAVASGSVVFLGSLVLIILAMTSAVQVPEITDHRGGGGGPIIIGRAPVGMGWLSADQVILAVAMLAILSLTLTSVVAWFMARRAVRPLAQALRLQRHFVADASHELRTPLTALNSRVQILQRRLDAGKPIDDVVDQLGDDTANMARVLDDMLLTIGETTHEGISTSVAGCLRRAVTSLDTLGEESQVSINVRATSDLMVAVPQTSLTRAIVALVDNAIEHSPAGTTVEVSVEPVDSAAVIRVRDRGSGIQGVKPEAVFDRFAHGEETGRKRSFGLGLALASEVAHRFDGDIYVESTSSAGTTFALSFPLTG